MVFVRGYCYMIAATHGIVQSNYSKIVRDKLVFWFDAMNDNSYPGTGTTWTDLSGNRVVGTLVNGPTFNSDNGGSIVFDRVDDYVEIPYDENIFAFGTGDFTFDCWYYQTSDVSYQRLYSNGEYTGGHQGIFQVETPDGVGANLVVHIDTFYTTYTTSAAQNVWRNVIVTRRAGTVEAYMNGVSLGTQTQSGVINSNTNPTLGNNSVEGGNYYGGRIAIVRLYKGKNFSTTEVLQNFNATRTRFGV